MRHQHMISTSTSLFVRDKQTTMLWTSPSRESVAYGLTGNALNIKIQKLRVKISH